MPSKSIVEEQASATRSNSKRCSPEARHMSEGSDEDARAISGAPALASSRNSSAAA